MFHYESGSPFPLPNSECVSSGKEEFCIHDHWNFLHQRMSDDGIPLSLVVPAGHLIGLVWGFPSVLSVELVFVA